MVHLLEAHLTNDDLRNHQRSFRDSKLGRVVRYVSSNYHHNSAKCEKSLKLGTTNKQ